MPFLLATSLLGASTSVEAQVVRVTVADSASGTNLPGVLVTLVSTGGDRVESRVANSAGRTVLRAPAAGSYSVRIERIGYRPWSSPVLRLAAGDTASLHARVASRRIVLAAMTIEGETRCVVDPARNEQTADVWEEARKALESSRLAPSADLVTMELHNFERLTTLRGRLLEERLDTVLAAVRSSPYATATPGELSRAGWVQDDLEIGHTGHYHAPDADVLLSEAFLREHCFSLVESREDTSLVGLAFRPVPSRRLPDVTGVLWLHRASAELRSVEFSYVNVRPALFSRDAGGRITFSRLDSGAWIVSAWEIRMPLISAYMARTGLRDPQHRGFREQGGRVARVHVAPRGREHSDGDGG